MSQPYSRYADIKRLSFINSIFKNDMPPDAEILDVGCGNGIISTSLGKLGCKVLGIDISEKAIEKAKAANILKNVQFRVISAEELMATGKKYDMVICSEVLEHLNNPGILLQTLYDILKDNGKLIVTVPNGKGPRELLVTRPVLKMRAKNNGMWKGILVLKKILGYSGSTVQSDADNLDHVQFFTKKDLLKLSSEQKFKIVSFANANFIDDVFPISFFTNRFKILQQIDSKIADLLPHTFTGGFMTVWEKEKNR